MQQQKVDQFMLAKGKYFPEEKSASIRGCLLAADDSKDSIIISMQFKDPTIALLLSLFLGGYGIDRFYLGDTGLGIGKLLTCGGFGIWAIIDWFLIMGATREKNYARLCAHL